MALSLSEGLARAAWEWCICCKASPPPKPLHRQSRSTAGAWFQVRRGVPQPAVQGRNASDFMRNLNKFSLIYDFFGR
jgi:hypothetical protein